MDGTGLSLERLETDKDVAEYLDLIRRIWSEEPGVDSLAKKIIDNQPNMTLKNCYVMKDHGKMVSTLNLIPVKWSIGGVPLRVAEMGHVGTLPEYRERGLIRRLVEEYQRDVDKQGYDLSVIEGIPYFYRQFGYEYAIPLLEETRIGLRQIPDFQSEIKIRTFAEDDIPKAMKLLESAQSKYYVHSLRDEAVWKTQQETCFASDPEPFQGFAVEEDRRLTAYFRMREIPKEKELLLTEVSEVDLSTAQAILSFLRQYGMRRGLEILSVAVGYQEPLVQHVVALGGVKRTPPYAWQIRVVDYVKMFKKIKRLLEFRLAGSMYHRLTETLNFNLRLFTVRITVKDGKIEDICKTDSRERSPIGFNPEAFTQLLLGNRSRQELEEAFPDVRIALSHRPLIDVLFPKLPSYIHSAF